MTDYRFLTTLDADGERTLALDGSPGEYTATIEDINEPPSEWLTAEGSSIDDALGSLDWLYQSALARREGIDLTGMRDLYEGMRERMTADAMGSAPRDLRPDAEVGGLCASRDCPACAPWRSARVERFDFYGGGREGREPAAVTVNGVRFNRG